MRLGIFADIHGNKYAFEKIFDSLRREKPDMYVFCGDICGYYYHQDEVIDALEAIDNLICVRGNHDDMFVHMLTDSVLEEKYMQRYGKACRLLKERISKPHLRFLEGLPEKADIPEYNIGIFHGSPWNYLDEYVYPWTPMKRFAKLSYDTVLLGHTHRPMDKKVGNLRIINPGACGQPRDQYQPSYALFDVKSGTCEIKRIEYNPGYLIADIKKHGEANAYLEEVLMRRETIHG